jgi:glycosyltransferase involved in cell wall biosynthesis
MRYSVGSVMERGRLPKVSALMGAYNYADYIVEAIRSAMEQDYPAELLELVIVDDGSTDNTAELVGEMIERYPSRIKFVQQQNAGATAATNRARTEATGDLIALLDADDVWLPTKTRRQVEMMMADPELGLTWTSMRLVNGSGQTLRNNYGHIRPLRENQFARVLWENVAVQSALIIDADLFEPMPTVVPYADWWLTLIAAEHKKIGYIAEDLVLYRWHGANITGGVAGVKALREAQKGVGFQRWVIRNFELDELKDRLGPEDIGYVWTGLENQAKKGLTGLQSHFGVLATVTDQDRADAVVDANAAQAASQAGDLHTACFLLLRARACDPYDGDLRTRFDEIVQLAAEAAKLPDPMTGSHGFAVLADASWLLSDERYLRDYAQAMRNVPGVTLVIDASWMEPADAAAQLESLVQRCGLADADDVAMIGIVGELQPSQRFHVNDATKALYAAASPATSQPDAAPTFTPDSLPGLRELADAWDRDRPSA